MTLTPVTRASLTLPLLGTLEPLLKRVRKITTAVIETRCPKELLLSVTPEYMVLLYSRVILIRRLPR